MLLKNYYILLIVSLSQVYEMKDEVERHRLIRDSLELELRTLRQRLSTVENITDIADSENANSVQKEDSITRRVVLFFIGMKC